MQGSEEVEVNPFFTREEAISLPMTQSAIKHHLGHQNSEIRVTLQLEKNFGMKLSIAKAYNYNRTSELQTLTN